MPSCTCFGGRGALQQPCCAKVAHLSAMSSAIVQICSGELKVQSHLAICLEAKLSLIDHAFDVSRVGEGGLAEWKRKPAQRQRSSSTTGSNEANKLDHPSPVGNESFTICNQERQGSGCDPFAWHPIQAETASGQEMRCRIEGAGGGSGQQPFVQTQRRYNSLEREKPGPPWDTHASSCRLTLRLGPDS